MKIIKKLFMFIVVFFIACNSASATTLQDLYNELSSLEKNYAAAQSKANLTKAEMNKIKANIANTEAEIKTAQNEITQAENDIVTSEKEIEKKKEETNQMLLYLQVMNSTGDSMLEYVFEADNYTDFIYRYAVVTQMSEYNQDLMTELETLVNQLTIKKQELAQKQEQLAVKKAELQSQYAIIKVQYEEETDEGLNIADEIAAKKKLIKYYESIGCKRSSNINSCNGVPAVDGWTYPLKSFRQSSNYGWDENRYHYAVDLAVSEGSTVYAVGNGTVIYSGVYWKETGVRSCGGLVIQIRHTYKGTDYISLYMHMLSSSVSVGTKVSAGDPIGKSGGGSQSIAKWKDTCTGGAHLHFTMAYAGNSDIYNVSSSKVGTTFNPVKFFPAMKGIGSRL
ncbi:MAG: peptidoglycan DD-metalloendopeptidase family protein [Bacilli bacterium]|nr:peptidoglycan DD-metalloendopeptidase family protein [Bacilli bacterium]